VRNRYRATYMEKNLEKAIPFLMVFDLTHSLEFYVAGLGFEIKREWKPAERIEWCLLEREGVSLMLQEYRPGFAPTERQGVGVSIFIVCRDALKLYTEFQQQGLSPEEPFVGNSMWVVSLNDPDGYRLNFESGTHLEEGTMYSAWVKTFFKGL
jgi:lactoylglutathione lyase